ncbi:MAG: helix-turn-helix domain-containing protein [Bacteroidales bacterium]|jgi:DNA-binding transcriptional regulator GbsR (MarR family)|nr:helix-turn-helix domain-containing protein [Bacteroidales bacterium]
MSLQEQELTNAGSQVYETGKVFEKFGLAPVNGRVLALFTVSEKAELTFEQICDYFGTSKSVISNSLNLLLSRKLIDFRTYKTGRKRYFFLTDRFFMVYFGEVLAAMGELREVIYKTLSQNPSGSPEVSSRMLRWVATANIFEKELESAFEQLGRN